MPVTARTGASVRTDASSDTGRNRRWPIVATLALSTTVGYGVLHYAFAVLLEPIAYDLDASTTAVTGALTVSVLTSAVAAVPVGRWLDRRGGRGLMTVGSIVAAVLVLAWSRVDALPALYLVQAGIGLAGAMTLYGPALAVVVTWFPEPHRRANALLAVTVVAGFASTVFMPLTGFLTAQYGWRNTLLILAAVYATTTVPGHWLVVRRPPYAGRNGATASRPRRSLRAVAGDRRFWTLSLVFVAHVTATATVGVHLVIYLVERGHPATFAATVAGLLGVLSVTGRLTLTTVARRFRVTSVVAVVFLVQGVGALALAAVAGSAVGAVVAVLLFGLGFGVAAVAQPALVADIYGTAVFGAVSGMLAVPVTLAKATAPVVAAEVRSGTGSYLPVLVGVAVACVVAAVGAGVSGRYLPRGR
ncbi:MFS transporter [Plantactinospora soyae]|uniref:MFS family arabinose efflux permease n=1 Tax=Plantactinospora soyae TaxID=1544732 RepID=A0A927MCJ7_9ACTN|nr:MFS transporter [Plantactinospora soyae]MBE1492228.1 putative MFS family arabinose efflux permease [Plantactinospora soyae]